MKGSIKTEIEVSNKRIVDLFISACEGGSNYWCQELTPTSKRKDPYEAMLDGFVLVDGEDGKKHTVTPAMIKTAVQIFPLQEPHHFGDFMSENDDATTADVFLQLCVFGKTIYG